MLGLLVVRPHKIVNIDASTNDVNLYTSAGNPTYPLNLIAFINASVGSSAIQNPAFRTANNWASGTYIAIKNNSTITGSTGATGSDGTMGYRGTAGVGGNGGPGAGNGPGGTGAGAGPLTGGNATSGGTGGPGGTGATGGTGGVAFLADTIINGRIALVNSGSIIGGVGGPGGPGGPGGEGGKGGGGGGGGGGLGNIYTPASKGVAAYYSYYGGSGGGGGTGAPGGAGGGAGIGSQGNGNAGASGPSTADAGYTPAPGGTPVGGLGGGSKNNGGAGGNGGAIESAGTPGNYGNHFPLDNNWTLGPGGAGGGRGPTGSSGATGPAGARGIAIAGNTNIRFVSFGTITGTNQASYLGRSPQTAAASASALVSAGITTDGVYWINLPTVGPTPVYCLLDSGWDGGGWMMMMKATRGTTFNYASSYWTSVNTLNPTAVNRSNGDAKFDVMNYFQAKDILAVWPDLGDGGSIAGRGNWTWLQNNWYASGSRITPISFFSTQSLVFIQDADTFTGGPAYGNFSSQVDIRFYGFNFAGYTGTSRVRWGFGFNENGEGLYSSPATLAGGLAPGSDDVSGGIGMDSNFGNYSAGDYIGCCQNRIGINRSARVEIYVR